MIKKKNRQEAVSSRPISFLIAILCLTLIVSLVYADNPATGTTTTGQELNIEIAQPADGDTLACNQPLTVSGVTALGPLDDMAHVVYVVDISGSTSFETDLDCNGNGLSGDAGDDYNQDGINGDILDCEISGVIALNDSLIGTNTDASIVGFGSDAFVADIQPDLGFQIFTQPLESDRDSDGVIDINEVVTSMDFQESGGGSLIGLFSPFHFDTGTNFDGALLATYAAFASQPTSEQRVAFFLSDGDSPTFTIGTGSPVQQVADANITVNTYSIGAAASGCGPDESLGQIAAITGGTCTVVDDPSQLAAVLGGITPTGLDYVTVSLNSGTPMTASLNALGGWTATFPPPVPGDSYLIEANVAAADGTIVTADINTTAELCTTPTPPTPTSTPLPPPPTPTPPPPPPPPPGPNCTYTQGYWKNHPQDWPVTELTLGDTTYTLWQAIEILKTPPRGNVTYILAHQLIAAKLNIANGADDTAVATTISEADTWLTHYPPGSSVPRSERATATALARYLDQYNNGLIGPGHCSQANKETIQSR